MQSVVDRVEDFLIGTSRFAVSAKLLVADRYRLIRLQVRFLGPQTFVSSSITNIRPSATTQLVITTSRIWTK